jgi:hypothetical protein
VETRPDTVLIVSLCCPWLELTVVDSCLTIEHQTVPTSIEPLSAVALRSEKLGLTVNAFQAGG